MRSYPRNSPEAAARLVALVLISDGHVCRSEIETLQRLGVERELGLAPGSFSGVVHALCEDLLLGAYASGSVICQLDPGLLASLLAEVDEPGLQRSVLELAAAAAEADRHLAEAEDLVLSAAARQWGLDEPLRPWGRPAAQSAAAC
ncbi:TerB family tellurite resistance protein [Pelomonas cellulosilytica]|uniref:TerB family tellurite resistance protein n=1 Tax=Pelomonas cellulosilytica TaxID=2906762 RepID=A0ABS8Y1R7_9BURK|nr:TerB family tellurite resistance protein [Pelomonas sp. P8]MCE4556996.1 TerB family tellurite resistance protein [Pelomonas sp. P8]